MPPAARVGDETAHGTPLFPGTGSEDVLIGGLPTWRAEIDQHACPEVDPVLGPDGVGNVMMGSPTVLINGMMACRQGDLVEEKPGLALGPVNVIVMGCPTVVIGDAPMGMPSMPAMSSMGMPASSPSPQVASMTNASATGAPFVGGAASDT